MLWSLLQVSGGEVATPSLDFAYVATHGQSQDAHLDLGLWTQYLLCGHFLDVIKATPKAVVGDVTHDLGVIHVLGTMLITIIPTFYSSQTHFFP